MPAKLVTGTDAEDVAAYVAQAAARPGQDTGALATVGQAAVETPSRRPRAARSRSRRDPSGAARLQVQPRRGARGPPDRSTRRTTSTIDARHRDRGQRRQREGRGRHRTAASRGSRPRSSPATTRSSAPCPATARAAWRASSPSSRRRALPVHARALPRRDGPHLGCAASSRSCCCAARQKKNEQREDHDHDVERRPSARRRSAGRPGARGRRRSPLAVDARVDRRADEDEAHPEEHRRASARRQDVQDLPQLAAQRGGASARAPTTRRASPRR